MTYKLGELKLIPAWLLGSEVGGIPARAGVYLFFINRGLELLKASSYFDTDVQRPMHLHGYDHLYTGAAHNLSDRLEQHLRRNWQSSSFRKSLLAVEHAFGAIRKTKTPGSKITGDKSLTEWLRQNLLVGFQFTNEPFVRERELILGMVSPLNIIWRKEHPYSNLLMDCRQKAFTSAVAKRWYR